MTIIFYFLLSFQTPVYRLHFLKNIRYFVKNKKMKKKYVTPENPTSLTLKIQDRRNFGGFLILST